MPTLTTVTSRTKSTLKWLSISLAYLSILFAVIKIGVAIKERLVPTPPPPPTVTFGILPPISFPKSTVDKKLTYSIDTISGFLPIFPPQAKAYIMGWIKPQFLALDIARQKTSRVGIRSSEVRLSENWYRWTDQSYPLREITLNIFSHDFSVSSPFLSDPLAPYFATNFSSENGAINTARNFLRGMSSLKQDIDLAKTKTLLYSIKDGSLVPETKVTNAQVIRIDFFQKDIDNLPIYYPNATTSTLNFLVANIQNRPLVIGANFPYQSVVSSLGHTYPIKTAVQAFLELKDQKAYIASYFGESTNIAIKDVFLGYYMRQEKQEYLMPIIIFKGENGFFAYVSAVIGEWISK